MYLAAMISHFDVDILNYFCIDFPSIISKTMVIIPISVQIILLTYFFQLISPQCILQIVFIISTSMHIIIFYSPIFCYRFPLNVF